jgi:hypothetical protein
MHKNDKEGQGAVLGSRFRMELRSSEDEPTRALKGKIDDQEYLLYAAKSSPIEFMTDLWTRSNQHYLMYPMFCFLLFNTRQCMRRVLHQNRLQPFSPAGYYGHTSLRLNNRSLIL